MKLKRVKIQNFKNLKDFEVEFEENSSLNLIIGNNGSGKSNFFEAISLIFYSLYDNSNSLSFKFEIEYEYYNQRIFISNMEGKLLLKINGNEENKSIQDVLPNNIFAYYSGNNDRFENIFKGKLYDKYWRSLLNGDEVRLRKLFYIEQMHYKMAFLSAIAYNSEIINTIKELTGFEGVECVNVVFKVPYWNNRKSKDVFWGAKGSSRLFLEKLKSIGNVKLDENSNIAEILINDIQTLKTEKERAKELFANFDALYIFDMLQNIEIILHKKGIPISYDDLSEGEKQFLLILCLIDITNESETLSLLDEPDTFLHPGWQRELTENIQKMDFYGQWILTTHSPLSLGGVEKENIVILQNGQSFYPSNDTLNRDVGEILEETMKVGTRPDEVKELIEEFNEKVAFKDIDNAKIVLERIKNKLSPTDPFLVKAAGIILRMGIKR